MKYKGSSIPWYRPTGQQVLILLNSPTTEIIIANAALVVKFYTKSLVETHSKLRVEFVHKT